MASRPTFVSRLLRSLTFRWLFDSPPDRLPLYAEGNDRNIYRDGASAGDDPPATSPACDAGDLQRLVADYMHPPLMAIGGSVYNGVTSLKTTWFQSEWSAPALVAIALGLIEVRDGVRTGRRSFRVPLYPDHGSFPAPAAARAGYDDGALAFTSGFDIERATVPGIAALVRTQARNARLLRDAYLPPDRRLFNDNIGISGSDSHDVLELSPKEARRLLGLCPPGGGGRTFADLAARAETTGLFSALGLISPLTKVALWANAAFVLNPQRHPCLDGLSALQQVMLRKPERVLINVGSNDGIYEFMLNGTAVDEPLKSVVPGDPSRQTEATTEERFGEDYPRRMRSILEALRDEPAIKYVYVNGNMRATAAANLVPEAPGKGHAPGKLFARYWTGFGLPGARTVSEEDARQANALISRTNARLRTIVDDLNRQVGPRPGLGTKFVYIDLEALSDQLDHTHFQAAHHEIPVSLRPGHEIGLTNARLTFGATNTDGNGRPIAPAIEEGGVFGMDNLHPTLIGYAVLARFVVDAIRRNEGLAANPAADAMVAPSALYANDDIKAGHLLRNADEDLQGRSDRFQAVVAVFYTLRNLVTRFLKPLSG